MRAPKSSSKEKEKEVTAYRRPDANVFTLMLVISLAALIVACIFLYVEMRAYDFKTRVTLTLPAAVGKFPSALAGATNLRSVPGVRGPVTNTPFC